MLGNVLRPEIEELIHDREWDALRIALGDLPPVEIAEILGDMTGTTAALVFRVLPRGAAAEAFAALPLNSQEEIIRSLSEESVAGILSEMPADDRTRLLEELPAIATQRLINLLTPGERAIATKLLGYPEESIGRLMTPDYIIVHPDWTVAKALDHVRKHAHQSETANVLYVVDDSLRLLDDLKLAVFVMATPEALVKDLTDGQFVSLKAMDDREVAIPIFKKHYRVALPVTDSQGIMLGIVTLDDILAIAEEEATEDMQKIGGMEALDAPYLATPFKEMIRKRAGWLMVLFVGEMLTATAMAGFEHELANAVVLALFVPLIISSGGNSGSQAASLIIRALGTGELPTSRWREVLMKELASGLVLGVILGAVGFLRIALWSTFSDVYGPHWMLLGITIFFTLVGIVLWGTITGSMFPILLKKLGLDPAVSSAPFVATLVDVTGIVIYFELAQLFFLPYITK